MAINDEIYKNYYIFQIQEKIFSKLNYFSESASFAATYKPILFKFFIKKITKEKNKILKIKIQNKIKSSPLNVQKFIQEKKIHSIIDNSIYLIPLEELINDFLRFYIVLIKKFKIK